MKNTAIVLTLIIVSLFAIGCGGETKQAETENEGSQTTVSGTNRVTSPQINSNTTGSDDNDADDVYKGNSSQANKTDADDSGQKDSDDIGSSNQNANVRNTKRTDPDDTYKKGDADDRGRPDKDDDDDDH